MQGVVRELFALHPRIAKYPSCSLSRKRVSERWWEIDFCEINPEKGAEKSGAAEMNFCLFVYFHKEMLWIPGSILFSARSFLEEAILQASISLGNIMGRRRFLLGGFQQIWWINIVSIVKSPVTELEKMDEAITSYVLPLSPSSTDSLVNFCF